MIKARNYSITKRLTMMNILVQWRRLVDGLFGLCGLRRK